MQVAHPTVWREIRLSWGVWPRRKMVEGLGVQRPLRQQSLWPVAGREAPHCPRPDT